MKTIFFVIVAGLLILSGCSSSYESDEDKIATQILDDFESTPEILIQHPSWGSRDADFFLENGDWKLKASGTHISETWKTYKDTLPPDQDWSVSVDVTVPYYWDTMETEEAQVGAGVFVGKVDPDKKSRTVYETNLAAIANRFRFVQGQLIKNRLGDDPIAVGFMKTDKETVNLKIAWDSQNKQILFFMDHILVDVKHIDAKGIHDWNMEDDKFYVGVMGFAENTDITSQYPSVDNFEIVIKEK
jgi:hypothetical protein